MILTDATSLKSIADLNEILSEINVDDEESDREEDRNDGGSPKSAGGAPEEEEEDVESEEEIGSPKAGLNLSEDIMKSFDDLKISDSDDDFANDKENSTRAKRNSRGKSGKSRNSAGSAASRRSRLRNVN